ncbi:helix-turn-helix transcriptional regulator [Domibacillus aminovorans]|uniref:Transcriptional regulator n=1 Tax=Domibacillus aminovorans TaxID=29332 RepID=A0A177KZE1_9BACI|nr:helix-turn-helix transcriptional regulator [Domibacillus aminovorans]OAH58788.1 transcriptional regulator [Domibacillus aminovorans]
MNILNEENTKILHGYIPVADMIVATFGSNCEVVIHDVRNVQSSLIYIKGAVTGREIGAPTTEVILKELRRYGDNVKDMLGLTARTRDGKFLKTSISFIRNPEGKVIGFLGINFDVTAFAMVNQIISEFSVTHDLDQIDRTMNESYAKNIEEVFENLIENTLIDIHVPIDKMSREDKIYFVNQLDEKGAFLIQGSVDRITEVLGVSKQTIYNYLEESRTET